jgi:hypothetical protein
MLQHVKILDKALPALSCITSLRVLEIPPNLVVEQVIDAVGELLNLAPHAQGYARAGVVGQCFEKASTCPFEETALPIPIDQQPVSRVAEWVDSCRGT